MDCSLYQSSCNVALVTEMAQAVIYIVLNFVLQNKLLTPFREQTGETVLVSSSVCLFDCPFIVIMCVCVCVHSLPTLSTYITYIAHNTNIYHTYCIDISLCILRKVTYRSTQLSGKALTKKIFYGPNRFGISA